MKNLIKLYFLKEKVMILYPNGTKQYKERK